MERLEVGKTYRLKSLDFLLTQRGVSPHFVTDMDHLAGTEVTIKGIIDDVYSIGLYNIHPSWVVPLDPEEERYHNVWEEMNGQA